MDRGITIKGSLPRFLNGSNFESLDVAGTRQAFEKLQDLLSFSVKDGIITSVDIAQNIELDHPPEMYLSLFGNSRRTQPKRWKETTYYEIQSIKKTFYDKGEEIKSKGIPTPPDMEDKNLLRYELRYKKGFRRKFGMITPEKLLDSHVRNSLIDHWLREYQIIEKYNWMKPDYSKAATPGEIGKVFLLELISIIGIDEVVKRINKESGADRKNRYRTHKMIRGIMKDKDHTVYPDLLTELDRKMKEAAMAATD